MSTAACLTWCLTAACTGIAWNPVPDPDVAFYRVRDDSGFILAEVPCCELVLPEVPTLTISIVAVDLAGNESETPTILPWGEAPCTDGSGHQWGSGPCMEIGPCAMPCDRCVEWQGDRCLLREPIPGVTCCQQPVCDV